jgi:Putative  PD-(D/E)XK family member, (DUF4420)
VSDRQLSALERGWAVLTPPRAQALTSFPLDISIGDMACRVALDSSGARHVLIPIDGETLQPDQRPSVLGLTVRRLTFGPDDRTYVDLSCAERELFSEFDDVAVDVLDTALEADRPGAAAIRAIMRWRRLFRSRLVRGLSYQARLGLFAELTMLSALLETRPDLSVDVWRGPLREPHDFEAPVACLEVKALGPASDSITVHGLGQMDSHDGRPLELILVDVVEDSDGTTLSDLVDRLRNQVLSPVDLRSRLTAAGWSPSPDTEDTDAFSIGAVRRISVQDGVPRLTKDSLVEGTLPDGLSDLQYSLDVAALLPFASSASLPQVAQEAGG